jgi:hypothetical protein
VRADGSGAGLQSKSGEKGTVQASQCGCRAAGGAFAMWSSSRLAACLESVQTGPQHCQTANPQKHALSFTRPRLVCCAACCARQPRAPIKGAGSGARPVWKTIIHVLLALSSTLDLLRFKFPPYTARPPQLLNLSFLAAAAHSPRAHGTFTCSPPIPLFDSRTHPPAIMDINQVLEGTFSPGTSPSPLCAARRRTDALQTLPSVPKPRSSSRPPPTRTL